MSFRNRVYHLYESVPFTGKRPKRPETGIKHGFEEMEHEFLLGYLHRRTGNFLPGRAVIHLPKKFLQVAQIFTKQSKGN